MQILVNTDNHIGGSEQLASHVQSIVEDTLGHFGPQITRVEVHLNDENSAAKPGDNDKRCLMEARLAGLEPIAVSHQGATLDQAIDGAVEKLEHTLNRTVGKIGHKKGRTSYGGDQEI